MQPPARWATTFALSYASVTAVGQLCGLHDSCYYPTRVGIILGVPQSGGADAVSDITLDEGIVDRIVLALETLAVSDPTGRWGTYLVPGGTTPEARIDWNKVVVSGHSQGGGHAAVLGKLFAVSRVIQLSSVCDAIDTTGTPASWTRSSNGPWVSDPTQFYGLAAPTVFTGSSPPVAIPAARITQRTGRIWAWWLATNTTTPPRVAPPGIPTALRSVAWTTGTLG